ncbi:MAG: SDR family oxidoreductase [Chloroflexota bacterium]|nr:SDR family oxidoreductase [Chloroflexota bacterium]
MSIFRADALAGQHIVISGGCGAIGLGIIKGVTEHGAVVSVNDLIAPDDADARLNAAGIAPDRVNYIRGDLTQVDAVIAFIDVARSRFGAVHTALCHAGVVLPAPLLDATVESFDQTMAVNVRAAFLLGQVAARAMIADGVRGHLLFTTSWVAETPWPGIGAYNSSKAAMNQLMRTFARELADRGVRANAIAPGIVGIGMAKRQFDTEPDYRARVQKAIPLGDMQTLDSVVDAFLFACSPAAAYITGAVLTVDGGCSLYPMD